MHPGRPCGHRAGISPEEAAKRVAVVKAGLPPYCAGFSAEHLARVMVAAAG